MDITVIVIAIFKFIHYNNHQLNLNNIWISTHVFNKLLGYIKMVGMVESGQNQINLNQDKGNICYIILIIKSYILKAPFLSCTSIYCIGVNGPLNPLCAC